MAKKRDIKYEVSADSSKFAKSLKEANTAFDRFQRDTKKKTSSIRGSLKRISTGIAAFGAAATAAAGAYVAAVHQITKSAADSARQIQLQAEALGTSTEKFQTLSEALGVFDVSQGRFEKALTRTSKALTGASQGSDKYVNALEKMGLEVADVVDLDPASAFEKMRDAISEMEDPMDQLAAAQAIFGENTGRQLLPALQESAEAFSGLEDHAKRFGLVLSEEAIDDAREYHDAMADFSDAIKGLKTQIGAALLPVVKNLMQAFTPLITKFFESESSLDGLKEMALTSAIAFGGVVKAAEMITRALKLGIDVMHAYYNAIYSIAGAADDLVRKIPGIGKQLGMVTGAYKGAVGVFRSGTGAISDGLGLVADTAGLVSDTITDTAIEQRATLGMFVKEAKEVQKVQHEIEQESSGGAGGSRVRRVAKQVDELAKLQARYLDLIKTPADLFQEKLGEIDQLFSAGRLNADQYAAAIEILRNQYDESAISAAKLKKEGDDLARSLRTSSEITEEKMARYAELLEAGAISSETYKRAIDSLNDSTGEIVKKSRDVAEKVTNEWREVGEEFKSIFADGLGNVIFETITGGFSSAKDAVMALIAEVAKLSVKLALLKGVDPGGGSGLGGLFDALPGFSHGGRVHGPGTGTSDSILAWVSKGEYIIPAHAARSEGYGNLDARYKGSSGGRPGHYATGGEVSTGAGISIINVTDPSEILSTMAGAAGGRVVFNAISQNLPKYRRLFGI